MEKLAAKKVKDIMRRRVKNVKETDSLKKVASIFKSTDLSCLPVVNEKGKIVGDVHERDLLKVLIGYKNLTARDVVGVLGTKLDLDHFAKSVGDIMNSHNFEISEDKSVLDAAILMDDNSIRSLLVKDKAGKVVGVLDLEDLVEKVLAKIK